ncbi:hypothetical protein [Burkholderia sp. Ac-20344]|uniref:hypothetical protein n=1 Tax=Burkholderia sp. Ac-20344 TaxID=2703890 RepID=UPI00197C57BA|nr:hypothetical protein [Burkholderia sp. Ac-20344]MBN3830696.1 hypothetical protein [Burkholderia sp. Ac-20344]
MNAMTHDRSLPHAASHYVVKRSDAAGTDSRVHKKGAGRSQTIPELWNGASGSLAGDFRIACGDCGLEEGLEFGGGIQTVWSGIAKRSHRYVVDHVWYGRNDVRQRSSTSDFRRH